MVLHTRTKRHLPRSLHHSRAPRNWIRLRRREESVAQPRDRPNGAARFVVRPCRAEKCMHTLNLEPLLFCRCSTGLDPSIRLQLILGPEYQCHGFSRHIYGESNRGCIHFPFFLTSLSLQVKISNPPAIRPCFLLPSPVHPAHHDEKDEARLCERYQPWNRNGATPAH
jgi:hypothetical protein